MSEHDGRAPTLRFSLNAGTETNEGELLNQALLALSTSKTATNLLRALAMRGWVNLIHETNPAARKRELLMLGVPNGIVEEISRQWPVISTPSTPIPTSQIQPQPQPVAVMGVSSGSRLGSVDDLLG